MGVRHNRIEQILMNDAAVRERRHRCVTELIISLDKFAEAERAYDWVESTYLGSGDTTEARIRMQRDPRFAEAVGQCAYFRDRAQMFADAATALSTWRGGRGGY